MINSDFLIDKSELPLPVGRGFVKANPLRGFDNSFHELKQRSGFDNSLHELKPLCGFEEGVFTM